MEEEHIGCGSSCGLEEDQGEEHGRARRKKEDAGEEGEARKKREIRKEEKKEKEREREKRKEEKGREGKKGERGGVEGRFRDSMKTDEGGCEKPGGGKGKRPGQD